MKRAILFFALAGSALVHAENFNAAQVHSELTADQARQVLIVVLKHEKIDIKKDGMDIDGPFKVDSGIPSQRGFWEFGVTFDSPKYGATQVLGRYAVSRLTGDVWETNLCRRYRFPKLGKIQAAIRLKTGKSIADEKDARRGLGCTEE